MIDPILKGLPSPFKTSFAEGIYHHKYSDGKSWIWLANTLVNEIDPHGYLTPDEKSQLKYYIATMKFIPAGRYLYYAGKPANFYNNCFCLGCEEDTREEWARVTRHAMLCLMSGGGIGVDYSIIRDSNQILRRTGGTASGPIPLMHIMNEVGRNVIQGGSRRSAMYASLHHSHADIMDFIHAKDWPEDVIKRKSKDLNYPAPLDMTNISVNVDEDCPDEILREVIHNMCKTGEPGLSFNYGDLKGETLRNACTEFTSSEDSDVCNLGSVNMGRIDDLEEFLDVIRLAAKFLVLGGDRADLPYTKVREVREENRKIGLGLMGIHEWLLKRGGRYEMTPDLALWMHGYQTESVAGANEVSDQMSINRPKRYQAIAPTGTIGILASTTTGIEPIFAVAYKRRYLTNATQWNYEYVVDATAQLIIDQTGVDPDDIETSMSLAQDPERRIKMQYYIQKSVDMSISSTLNLPAWGTPYNNENTAEELFRMIKKYGPGLRGLTAYPDGARGGQPLEAVSYKEAKASEGMVFQENEERCKGGLCGI